MEDALQGNEILLLALAASARLAQGRTADELGLLSAFFVVLGDNLALLALYAASGDDASSTPDKSP